MRLLTIVPTEAEAEMVRALLRTAGIESFQRQTNAGAGAADGLPVGGAREVLVPDEELERAREILSAGPESS
jgi:Putative prokaryotic signal transducing protein